MERRPHPRSCCRRGAYQGVDIVQLPVHERALGMLNFFDGSTPVPLANSSITDPDRD
jgi:hypothetical protein